ncbi:hypothetical protein D9611_009573 [Ephemerocybe angulata]|uniref:Reverse transcriptase domain-containing protein n=1 Tax=Ephemerocybe angulata TaxID=980116 RepID=A0A8H5FG90_9AGAR|nr:hypothetical protein D9611_009573 [Tulosesus angulatus]
MCIVLQHKEIFAMDNDCLLEVCNQCLETGEIPTSWLRTQLIGLCKKGKPRNDPRSYRTIGLESCMLKIMTMLINERLVEWAEGDNLIPPSQNGFRAGYRTNNNMFMLRCAVDKARALGRPLYVAFVDMTNTFPSMDQATLWLKLRPWGAGGPLFDWLRKLYREMSYVVSHEGEVSEEFKADIGILIGDTCSPVLWALFMADMPD